MTLLLGTSTESGVVVSADGMSFQTLDLCTRSLTLPARTTLQKIFPFEERFIVAHHGKNKIGQQSVEAVVDACWHTLGIPGSVEEAALQLGRYVLGLGEATLDGGFWVTGRSRAESQVEGHRVLLPSGRAERIDEKFFMDGDGKRFVSPDAATLEHRLIRQLAEEAQARAGLVLFGGHTHLVTITENVCPCWDVEPEKGTLGCEDLLPPLRSPVSKLTGVTRRKDFIVTEMNWLKQEHFQRVRVMKGSTPGRHPTTLKGFEEHRRRSRPDWEPDARFYQLIGIGNEAERADESDVSAADAELYHAHVDDLVTGLPQRA
jgi:hypothetical protein